MQMYFWLSTTMIPTLFFAQKTIITIIYFLRADSLATPLPHPVVGPLRNKKHVASFFHFATLSDTLLPHPR